MVESDASNPVAASDSDDQQDRPDFRALLRGGRKPTGPRAAAVPADSQARGHQDGDSEDDSEDDCDRDMRRLLPSQLAAMQQHLTSVGRTTVSATAPQGETRLHAEEVLWLVDQSALVLSWRGGVVSFQQAVSLATSGAHGGAITLGTYLVYAHLKRLGFLLRSIVKSHDPLGQLPAAVTSRTLPPFPALPLLDVYKPSAGFKKSARGPPDFRVLCTV
nr:hypothetical protein HK105_007012 [Polyrhizophydium stewartii]